MSFALIIHRLFQYIENLNFDVHITSIDKTMEFMTL